MVLAQDLLLVDVEFANPDPEKGQLLQLSAVLLDEKNLLEKKFLNLYIRPGFGDGSLAVASKYLGIAETTLKQAPRQTDALMQFLGEFKESFQFASLGVENYIGLASALKRSGIKKRIEPPIFDAWTVLYLGASGSGLRKLPNLETIAGHFKMSLKSQRNAFERVRLTADLLRRVL